MQIRGFLKTSAIEWPGKISSVIFTSGCNFRCSFCHNPDLVDPKKLNRFSLISENEIFADFGKRKKWLDAVVVTGGEPTLQTDLIDFLTKVKALGLKVMIETNGSRPDVIARLLGCYIVDYLSIDIKGPLDKRYQEIVKLPGFQVADLQKTLEIVAKSGIPFELRTTVVPGIHDEKVLTEMAGQILAINKKLKIKIKNYGWFLQTFRPKNCLDPKFNKIKPFFPDDLKKFQTTLQKIIPGVELRGV